MIKKVKDVYEVSMTAHEAVVAGELILSQENLKQRIRESQGIIEKDDELVMRPPPFGETTFILKAAATQLVSIMIMSFLLLPLFDKGFSYWDDGAEKFVLTNFKIEKVLLQFSTSFAWPEFDQPRLELQFGIGFLLAALQYLSLESGSCLLIRQQLLWLNTHQDFGKI